MTRKLRLLRRAGRVLLFVLWLVVMTAPCFAFALAARGELSWRRSKYDGDRIWLIQERDQKGIGLEAVRTIGGAEANGPICVRNVVRFFLWEGSSEGMDVEYCECYLADGTAAAMDCP